MYCSVSMDRKHFNKFLIKEEESLTAAILNSSKAEHEALMSSDVPWEDKQQELWYAVVRKSAVQGLFDDEIQGQVRALVNRVKSNSGFCQASGETVELGATKSGKVGAVERVTVCLVIHLFQC